MKARKINTRVLAGALAVMGWSTAATAMNMNAAQMRQYFTITSVERELVEDEFEFDSIEAEEQFAENYLAGVTGDCNSETKNAAIEDYERGLLQNGLNNPFPSPTPTPFPAPVPGGKSPFPSPFPRVGSTGVTGIINTGLRVWQVIDANRPVVTHKSMMANALPKGNGCWTNLHGWARRPKSKTYRVRYKNGFGMTVVDFKYRVIFIYGGTDGAGKYMARISFAPTNINVKWGYKFNAVGKVNVIYNVSKVQSEPIAAAELSLNWQIESTFGNINESENFYIDAEGGMERIKD